MSIGILFAGQGAQYVGMAQDLYQQEKIVRDTFDEASEVLGYDLANLIFTDEEKLNQTKYTQPAVLTVDLALWRILEAEGLFYQVKAMTGLSLGEYAALVAGRLIDFKSCLRLVAKRAQYMAEASAETAGKMVAVLNTKHSLIEEICAKVAEVGGIVSPANYNTPEQIVIGGEDQAVEKAIDLLKKAGVKRFVELKVSGAFHTKLMDSATLKLALALEDVEFKMGQCTVIENVYAGVITKGTAKDLLIKQITHPVRFYESIATMERLGGIDTFIEVGPGKVLSGFLRKINPTLTRLRVENCETLHQTLSELERLKEISFN